MIAGVKLYAISDLHVGHADNRAAFDKIADHPDDWLILGGDIGETFAHLRHVLEVATRKFARVIWVPGSGPTRDVFVTSMYASCHMLHGTARTSRHLGAMGQVVLYRSLP